MKEEVSVARWLTKGEGWLVVAAEKTTKEGGRQLARCIWKTRRR